MSYFEDLTDYRYLRHFSGSGAKNVGWLDESHAFAVNSPSEEFLDRLWNICSVSVAMTRGVHYCGFCPPSTIVKAERHGKELLLGTAEIRVFSPLGLVYAAPNMIFHYVERHHYEPPQDFIDAILNELQPLNENYLARLSEVDPKWRETPVWQEFS